MHQQLVNSLCGTADAFILMKFNDVRNHFHCSRERGGSAVPWTGWNLLFIITASCFLPDQSQRHVRFHFLADNHPPRICQKSTVSMRTNRCTENPKSKRKQQEPGSVVSRACSFGLLQLCSLLAQPVTEQYGICSS